MLVRLDLTRSQQTVQAAHAAIEAARQLPIHETHPHLVICGIDDLYSLEKALGCLEFKGLSCFKFYEPDINNELTAIAVGLLRGKACRPLSKYKLL